MKHVKGNMVELFDKPTDILVHIVNCVALKSRPYSLCDSIVSKHKYANPYSKRRPLKKNLAHRDSRPQVGTVNFCFPKNKDGPIVANCFSQFRMGDYNSRYYMNCPHEIDEDYVNMSQNHDSYKHRLKYFKFCLMDEMIPFIRQNNEIKRIIFPMNIGCGVAKGKWRDYKNIIYKFEKCLFEKEEDKFKYEIIIVELVE